MDRFGNWIAAGALTLVVVSIVLTLLESRTTGRIGMRGWGPFRRESEPITFWFVIVIHIGLGLTLSELLVAWIIS